MKLLADADDSGLRPAIEGWTMDYKSTSADAVKAANDCAKIANEQARLDTKLRKDAGEIEAFNHLFNDDEPGFS